MRLAGWAIILVSVAVIVLSIRAVVKDFKDSGVFDADTSRTFTTIEVDRLLEAQKHVYRDSLRSAREVAQKASLRDFRAGQAIQQVAESLQVALDSATDARDSLQVAITLAETYRMALDTTQQAFARLMASGEADRLTILSLEGSLAKEREHTDSLSALVRRTPKGCRIPLLGLKCPTLVVGGVVTRQGVDVGVGFGIPLH